MNILWALYDPATAGQDGTHWTSRSAAIPTDLLEEFFYTVANPARPSDPNKLPLDQPCGGFGRLTAEWLFAYRFLNGGRDARGRPGRFVLIASFLRTVGDEEVDLAAIFHLEPPLPFVGGVVACPAPALKKLESEAPPAAPEFGCADCPELPFVQAGDGAIELTARMCARLSPSVAWHGVVGWQEGAPQVRIETITSTTSGTAAGRPDEVAGNGPVSRARATPSGGLEIRSRRRRIAGLWSLITDRMRRLDWVSFLLGAICGAMAFDLSGLGRFNPPAAKRPEERPLAPGPGPLRATPVPYPSKLRHGEQIDQIGLGRSPAPRARGREQRSQRGE